MRSLKLIFFIFFLISFGVSSAQKKSKGYFQKNRYAFQKARYGQTTKKYGKACDVFEKKRTKGEKKPILSLGRRKGKSKKVAEQN